MAPDLTPLILAAGDAARNVNNMTRDHPGGWDDPLYHEAKLLAISKRQIA